MDFQKIQSISNLPMGWSHYTFFNIGPTIYAKDEKINGHPSFSCKTQDSASMLLRQVEIPLNDFPFLNWSWKVDQNVSVTKSELEKEGDDSPARFFLIFESLAKKDLMLELYWSPQLNTGQEKRIHDFYHYVVRGKKDVLGRWYKESIDLKKVAAKAFGDAANLKLKVIGLFCDTDGSHSKSLAFFSNVFMSKRLRD